MMEIERKWLLREIPPNPITFADVEQFYVSIDPEVRLRKWESNGALGYVLTIKGNGTLVRDEIETDVSEQFYNDTLKFIDKEPIRKAFYIYQSNDGKEIDVSHVLNGKGFIYAEVEFRSIKAASDYEFPWPNIVIKEITEDKNYKMKNIWNGMN